MNPVPATRKIKASQKFEAFFIAKILSKESIKQLNKDLSSLKLQGGKTGKENLIELGIFNTNSRLMNKDKLIEVLTTIRENRN